MDGISKDEGRAERTINMRQMLCLQSNMFNFCVQGALQSGPLCWLVT